MKRMSKAAVRTAVNLLFFTVIGTAVLAFTYNLTHELIAKTEDEARLKLINQVAPATLYDNDLLQDSLAIAPDALLGNEETMPVYRGRLQGQPSLLVLEAVAPDGYSGKIKLLLAINSSGAILGVRVVNHKETPGLGDYIEIARNKWITLFNGTSHQRLQEADWKVKKDGGQFDYMAGATVTPRAVVKAVHKALHYFEENRDTLFAAQPSAGKASNP